MLVLDVDHVMVRFDSGLPFASRAVAESCVDCPMATSPAEVAMSTDATAGGPEESPPHAMANASVHGRRASRVRFIIIGFRRKRCSECRRERRPSNLGYGAPMAK